MLKLEILEEAFPLAQSFNISRGSKTEAKVIHVIANQDGFSGHGECVPYARYGETCETVRQQIEALPDQFSREELQFIIPAGAARNAVDCALWDLEAKQTGQPVWQLAGLEEPKPLTTAYTLSLNEPDEMLLEAQKNAHRPLLKIKLGTTQDIPRLEAVRNGAPKSTIIVDANEGWELDTFLSIQDDLKRLEIAMIEQPLPENGDEELIDQHFQIPLCADESAHTSKGLEELASKYDFVNIKLDKTGGLTHAIEMKQRAEKLGLGIFVGCMVASSLAMAPACLLAQNATYVDLDGPLLLSQDRENGMSYEGSTLYPATRNLWG